MAAARFGSAPVVLKHKLITYRNAEKPRSHMYHARSCILTHTDTLIHTFLLEYVYM